MVGDPLADAAVASLADFEPARTHELINGCMERDEELMSSAPAELRDFFEVLENPPLHAKFDPQKSIAGCRAFHKNSDMFFVGLVLDSVISGFTTGVSKSFYMTGRTTGNLRRLKQNTRHLVEITLPGGLERHGDGWKLTVRIRLIHAQVRRLLQGTQDWDVTVDGVPLHMSHMVLAATGFSAINLRSVRKLGVKLTHEESESFMYIWRYVTWLMGVPETILFNSEEEAVRLKEIGNLCEPQPAKESISLAHGTIGVVPELIGITEPKKAKRMLNDLYRISRALIGNELADSLEYPKQVTFGALLAARIQRKIQTIASKVIPGATPMAVTNFAGLLHRSVYDEIGISYRMPDATKDTDSTPW